MICMYKNRLYHAVEVYTKMYKTAETGLETCMRSARSVRFPRSYAFQYRGHERPGDACTPDIRFARDTYKSCTDATIQKACTNMRGLQWCNK